MWCVLDRNLFYQENLCEACEIYLHAVMRECKKCGYRFFSPIKPQKCPRCGAVWEE